MFHEPQTTGVFVAYRTRPTTVTYLSEAFHLEIKGEWKGTKSLLREVQWEVLTVKSQFGVGLLCFIKVKISTTVYQEISKYFILPHAGKL